MNALVTAFKAVGRALCAVAKALGVTGEVVHGLLNNVFGPEHSDNGLRDLCEESKRIQRLWQTRDWQGYRDALELVAYKKMGHDELAEWRRHHPANHPTVLRIEETTRRHQLEDDARRGYAITGGSSDAAIDQRLLAKFKGYDAQQAALSTSDLIQAQPYDQTALAHVLQAYDSAVVHAHITPNYLAARQRLTETGQRQKAALQAIAAQSAERSALVRTFEDTKKIDPKYRATEPAATVSERPRYTRQPVVIASPAAQLAL